MDNFKLKFVEEASDLLDGLEKDLLALEKNPEDKLLVQKVFRVMHTLKGNSGMFGFELIDRFTHEMETLYEFIRADRMQVSREVLDLTLAAVDHLKELLIDANETNELVQETHADLLTRVAELISRVENGLSQDAKASRPSGTVPSGWSTYYILFQPINEIFNNGTNPLYLLDEIHTLGNALVLAHLNRVPLLHSINPEHCYTYWEVILSTNQSVSAIEEVFIFVENEATIDIQKLSDNNLTENKTFMEKVVQLGKEQVDIGVSKLQTLANEVDIRRALSRGTPLRKEQSSSRDLSISSIRVSSDKLDLLMNMVSELVTTQARLTLFADQNNVPGLKPIVENIQKITRQLRDNAFSIVLIPIENMLTRFQRLVRDLSNDLGKDVVFTTEGAETELDKTIIESLVDPLMHILRNSLDHGIEDAEERKRKGKPKQGRINLKAYYSGASVMIEVRDDGAGIDPDLIYEKAVAKGIITPDRKLSRKEILDLVFLPSFSTAKRVTDVSGRGVGMDVVKRRIADVRGEVEIDSELGKGTTISIKLPLTLSITDGLLVRVAETNYVIPLSVVDKIYAVEHQKLISTFNNVVVLEGKQVPFFYIRSEFNETEFTGHFEQVVVVNYEEIRVGLVVDEVVGEYQAVLKPLGKHYKKQDMISGATIMGDGTVALVIDTNRIIKMFAGRVKTE